MESKKINQLATELAPDLSDLTIIGDPTTGISKKITLSQMASLFTGTVEEYANFAAFPLVGVADTIYIALDTNVLYRWNTGTSAYVELSPNIINSLVFSDANGFDGNISLVGSVATLTITTALTTGSVPFIGASGALSQDNANLFFDDTNNRLGINTNAPATALDVFGSGIIGRINGTSTNNAYLGFASAGSNKWSIGNVQSDHRFRIYNEATTSELVSVLSTGEFGIGIANPTTKFHIDGAASALIANLDANVSVAKSISFRSDNSARINLEVSGTESGSNAGANFFLRTYTDAGALLATPITITRSTGVVSIPSLALADLTGTLAVANGGTGITSLTAGRIPFGNGTSAFGSSANLFWDNTNNRLGINQATPLYSLDISGTFRATGAAIFGSTVQTGNDLTVLGGINLTRGAAAYIGTTDNFPLTFQTNGVGNRMVITTSGNVGIGTSSPNVVGTATSLTGILNVYDTGSGKIYARGGGSGEIGFEDAGAGSGDKIARWIYDGGILSFQRINDPFTSITNTPLTINAAGDLTVNGGATAGKLTLGYNFYILNDQSPEIVSFVASSGTSIFRWMRQTTTESMRLTSGGSLCIGYTTDAGYQLRMSGYLYVGGNIVVGGDVTVGNLAGVGTRSVSVNAGGQLVVSSDSSLKQEDTTHKIEGLAEILQLKPKAYKWLNDIEERKEEARTEIGFFANEVAPIIPSAAPKNNNGLYGFYDRAIIAALVKGMQEQQAQIEELKAKIK